MKIKIGPLKFHYVCCVGCFACAAVLCTPGRCGPNERCVQAACGCSFQCLRK